MHAPGEPSLAEKVSLKDTIEEHQRRGFFKRIFPTKDFLYYKQFFQEDRPLNYYIDAKLIAKKRVNTLEARLLNQQLPKFMQDSGV